MNRRVHRGAVFLCFVALLVGLVVSESWGQAPEPENPLPEIKVPTANSSTVSELKPFSRNSDRNIAAGNNGDARANPQSPTSDVQQVSADTRTGDSALPQISGRIYEPARIMAVVADQYILAGDLLPQADIMIWSMMQTMKPDELEDLKQNRERYRQMAIRSMIGQTVQSKMLFVSFLRTLDVEQRAHTADIINDKGREAFEEVLLKIYQTIQTASRREFTRLQQSEPQMTSLAQLMVKFNAPTMAELDKVLHRFNTNIDKQIVYFSELSFGKQNLFQTVDLEREISHLELLDYYYEHLEDYDYEAKARWQQMTVRFSQFENKQQAYSAIANMGNKVLLGADFAAVAKEQSQESKAINGGIHDWTEKGNLASTQIDEALFSLPVNQMSPIIEDTRGFHIIRVLDRTSAGRYTFVEKQDEIKADLKNQIRTDAIAKFMEKLEKEIPHSSILDQPRVANQSP
ncbi:MAG: peptidylprolyl isomerase [Pirellulales bacterium]|nr:peptidylprolyl isomerase [Pirellulales bacterium]